MPMQLVALNGPDQGRVFSLAEGQTRVFGRSVDAETSLNDPAISRTHFQIQVLEGRIVVSDRGSSGGTFVNRERIAEAEVHPNDLIRAGRTEFRFETASDELKNNRTVEADTLRHVPFEPQVQLFVEELCGELCRFQHVVDDDMPTEQIRVQREVFLAPNRFADIVVYPGDQPAYFVEINFDRTMLEIVASLDRKFKDWDFKSRGPAKLVLVVRKIETDSVEEFMELVRDEAHIDCALEIWDEQELLRRVKKYLDLDVEAISPRDLIEIRRGIDQAKWQYAFGESADAKLQGTLLWHFTHWRLRELRQSRGLQPDEILSAKRYRNVVVCLADLCSFSAYVRDTPDSAVVRDSLTSFYSKSRYAFIENGGMLYQFVGDEVIGVFGIPDAQPNYLLNALNCAKALVDIGDSTSAHWQRNIDRVQDGGGVHVALAVGDVELVYLRPYSQANIGIIGDVINMTARLMNVAGSGQIMVSNKFYQDLDQAAKAEFVETAPIEGRNVGSLKAWLRDRPPNK